MTTFTILAFILGAKSILLAAEILLLRRRRRRQSQRALQHLYTLWRCPVCQAAPAISDRLWRNPHALRGEPPQHWHLDHGGYVDAMPARTIPVSSRQHATSAGGGTRVAPRELPETTDSARHHTH